MTIADARFCPRCGRIAAPVMRSFYGSRNLQYLAGHRCDECGWAAEDGCESAWIRRMRAALAPRKPAEGF